VTYRDEHRLLDIVAAVDAIRIHVSRGALTDGLVFDAVRIRLLEIGEAVKSLPEELLSTEGDIPWTQIARMRDHLAHRYSTPPMKCCKPPSKPIWLRSSPPCNASLNSNE
jgi:uncharacterized protein with HEPN domain